MRVHLGSDHAGLDLKAHLLAWLTEHGYEPVDHGPFVYDALDDYPVFCLRAAAGVAADRARGSGQPRRGHRRLRQRRADGGQQGPRHPLRPGLVRGDRRLARQHNDAQVVSVGGRMHSLEDMTRFVEVFLADAVQRRRAARAPDRPARVLRGDRRPAAAPAARRSRARQQPRCLRATPSTASPRALTQAFAGRVVRRRQPAGPVRRLGGPARRRRCWSAEAWGKHLFLELPRRPVRARPPRALSARFDVHDGVDDGPRPGGPGAAAARGRPTGTAYADLRGATTCELLTTAERATRS